MAKESSPDPQALARHAAVCWIQQALNEHLPVKRAIALASEHHWGGQTYAPSTLEAWFYSFRKEGFSALIRDPRSDKGTRKALGPEACEALLDWRRRFPHIHVKTLVRQLLEKQILQPGTFSMPSVYQLLAEHALDPRSMKNNPHLAGGALSGPTKTFECAFSNELWMTDMMHGPTITLEGGQVLHTRLFGDSRFPLFGMLDAFLFVGGRQETAEYLIERWKLVSTRTPNDLRLPFRRCKDPHEWTLVEAEIAPQRFQER